MNTAFNGRTPFVAVIPPDFRRRAGGKLVAWDVEGREHLDSRAALLS